MPIYRATPRIKLLRRPAIVGGGGAVLIALGADTSTNGFSGAYSKTINGGSALSTGCVIIGVIVSDGIAPAGPAIGGTAMGTAVAKDASNAGAGTLFVYAADVTAGNGDAFTITNSASFGKIYIAAVFVTGKTKSQISATIAKADYASANAQSANPLVTTTSLTVPAGGFGISFFGALSTNTATPTAVDWSTSTSIFNSAGDTTSITGVAGITSIAHTATAGAGWTPGAFPNGGANCNFISGLLGITIG